MTAALDMHNKTYKSAKPFVKWVGGKTQLIENIERILPSDFSQKKDIIYVEPFVGGGAVLFWILQQYPNIQKAVINDINPHLIATYKAVKEHPQELISLLKMFQDAYLSLGEENRRSYYLNKRDVYNFSDLSEIETAALFIFLNRTCFNGLYRVNSKGKFNVPPGKYSNPKICDEDTIWADSRLLQKVVILCGDFEETVVYASPNTLFYFDPPYKPLSKTSSFNSYAKEEFDDKEQIRLCNFCHKIAEYKAHFILSNSDVKGKGEKDSFFDEIYKNYNIQRVMATRMVNANPEKRGKLSELMISNINRKLMARDFNHWLAQFRSSIADYQYYINFDKVFAKVDTMKMELNLMNSLIGSKNIEADFDNLLTHYPHVLKCIPILIAKREMEVEAVDEEGSFCFNFKKMNYSIEQYKMFMRKTGIFNLLENRIIGSLLDYVTGVEVGLDSNGRKNRGGHSMENLVESFLQKAGLVKDVTYFKEMYIHEIVDKWNIDLSSISNQGKTEKRFDFVVKTPAMIYGIETNFYGSSGSKLNETARSYKNIALETKDLPYFTFVWFTDGKGWNNARHNLEETFDVLEHIYNINDMENGIISQILK